MGKHVERVFKKYSLKLNTASHKDASWYTDTDGFLEHLPSWGSLCYEGPTLYKIIRVLVSILLLYIEEKTVEIILYQ